MEPVSIVSILILLFIYITFCIYGESVYASSTPQSKTKEDSPPETYGRNLPKGVVSGDGTYENPYVKESEAGLSSGCFKIYPDPFKFKVKRLYKNYKYLCDGVFYKERYFNRHKNMEGVYVLDWEPAFSPFGPKENFDTKEDAERYVDEILQGEEDVRKEQIRKAQFIKDNPEYVYNGRT